MVGRYIKLIKEDREKSEAVGIVIFEFGNIQELAGEFGIESGEDTMHFVSDAEAGEYLLAAKRSAVKKGIGMFLGICLPFSAWLFGAIPESGLAVLGKMPLGVTIIVLLCEFACMFGLFKSARVDMHQFEHLKSGRFVLDAEFEQTLYQSQQSRERAFKTKMLSCTIVHSLSALLLLVFMIACPDSIATVIYFILFFFIFGIDLTVVMAAMTEKYAYGILLKKIKW